MKLALYLKLITFFTFLSIVAVAQPGPGKSMEFNGSSNYVNCGTINLSGNAITIMGWINVQTFKTSSPYITSFLGTEIASGTNSHASVRLGDGSLDPKKVQFILLFGSNHIKLDGNQLLEANKWFHIACTYDGSSMKIYINGVLDASNSQTGSFSSNGTWEIGRNYADSRILDGEIDEASVWTSALSQTTIREWMCKKITTSHPNYASLKGYWPLDEGTGTSTTDVSPNSFNGTVTGSAMWRNSGAPIGNRSKYVYGSAYSIGISHPQGDSIHFIHTSGTVSGVHLYRVDDVPYSTAAPAPIQEIDTTHYWGIFPIGTSNYAAGYYYNGNDLIANANDCNIAMARRTNGYANTWANQAIGAVNYSSQILAYSGSSQNEFVVGISANGPHTFTYSHVLPLCNGDSNGQSTVHANGGLPPYSFQWESGATDSTANNLSAGYNIFTVTDANGCVSVDSALLSEPTAVGASVTTTNSTCKFSANGSLSATAFGGTSPYTYLWNDATAATTSSVGSLLPGNYTLTVTDANGCSDNFTFAVSSTGPDPTVQLGPSDTNICDGKVFGLTATVDNGPITSYNWSTGNTSAIQIVSSAGTYALTVTNNAGCIGMDTINIHYVQPVQVNLGNNVTATGSHTLDAGSQFLAYLWSNTATTQTIQVNSTGNYSVTTTDSNQCTSADTVKVTIIPVGVLNIPTNELAQVWPNPAENMIYVKLNNQGSGASYTMLDLSGRIIDSGLIKANSTQGISIFEFPSGPYFISLEQDGRQQSSRFIKL